jgi:hypothetical protein
MRNCMPRRANSVKRIARKMAAMLCVSGRSAGRGEAALPRCVAIASDASNRKT